MIYTISNGTLTAKIDSMGAELISLASAAEEYIWQGEIWNSHAPVLFPACGRIVGNTYTYQGKSYNMGKHGFAHTSDFAAETVEDDRLVLAIETTPESYASFPFEFKLEAEFALEGDTLRVSFTVYNKDGAAMPFMFGWHPAFNLLGDEPVETYKLHFGETNCLTHHLLTDTKFVSGAIEAYPIEGGEYTISEEEIYSQDTLIFSDTLGKVKLYNPACERSLEISWSDNLPYLALWKWPLSSARYICIEPWSGLPGDGVSAEVWENRLNVTLPAGEQESFVYTVKCK
ncbi:MAG: hypothetical protein IKC32_06195 [Clostridia bacterium]|nr:hypothetical protein [Clostridia bacterium]